MFASDLDDATKRDLARGARLTELLKQGQYAPMPFEKQTVSIFAGTNGYLDEIPVDDVLRFETELHDHIERKTGIFTTIRETLKLDDDTTEELKSVLAEFTQNFASSDQSGSKAGSEDTAAASSDEVEQEQIVRQKR